MNSVNLIGRLVADPELRYVSGDIAVTKFSIAVTMYQGGEQVTDFFSIVCWRHNAEFACKYFVKGMRIGVTGYLKTNRWTDKDGNKRQNVEVVASVLDFADGNKEKYVDTYAFPTYAEKPKDTGFTDFTPFDGDDDDLPF